MSSAVIAIHPTEFETRALSISERAQSIEVHDQASYEQAARFLLDVITPMLAEVHEAYDSIVKKNYDAWQEACAKRKGYLEPLERAKGAVSRTIAAYEAAQRAEREELEPFVRHKYHHLEERAEVYGYWAGAALKNGFRRIEFARKKEIEEHRDRFALTRDRNDQIFGVWVEHFDAMALKTMIHRVCKLLPKSAEAQTAWQLDERAEAGLPQKFSVDVPIEFQQSKAFDDTPDVPPDIGEPKRRSETVAQPAADEPERVSE